MIYTINKTARYIQCDPKQAAKEREAFSKVYNDLPEEDKKKIDKMIDDLCMIRGMGKDGAIELIGKMGLALCSTK